MATTFISDLAPDIAQRIRDAGASRVYAPRSYIFYEGDPGTGVFVVESGLLRIDRTTRRGRVVLLDLVTQGSLIGELSVLDGSVRSATLSTVTACTVRYLSAEAFLAMVAEDQTVQTAIIHRLARRLRGLSTQLMESTTLDAPARIAARLIQLSRLLATIDRVDNVSPGCLALKLPISQEEIGQWAGLSREATVKGLTVLRSLGLIETGRMRITILDLDGLDAMSH